MADREPVDQAEGVDPRAVRVLRVGVGLTIVAVAAQTIVHLVNIVFLNRHYALLDADSDQSIWTWASGGVTVVAAAFVALLAIAGTESRWRLALLAFLLAFLSADDVLAFHELISVPQLGPIPHASRVVWPIVFGPILGSTLLLLWFLGQRSPPAIRRVVVAGLVSLVIPVGLEAGTPILFALGYGHGTPPYEFEAVVEEGLELVGMAFLATGTGALVVERLTPEGAASESP